MRSEGGVPGCYEQRGDGAGIVKPPSGCALSVWQAQSGRHVVPWRRGTVHCWGISLRRGRGG